MGDESALPAERFGELLAELDEDPSDREHASVSVTHENDWCIGVYRHGLVIFEHLEDPAIEPRHMSDQDEEAILKLLIALSIGDLDSLESSPWRAGYGAALE